LIKDTLDHFLNKISKYLEHKYKERRVWNKEHQGRLGNMLTMVTGSQALDEPYILVHIFMVDMLQFSRFWI
jgi:hypothetical protein